MAISNLGSLTGIDGLVRCEDYDREALGELITEMTHTVYPHEAVYGQYCTVHAHIECPVATCSPTWRTLTI